MGKLISLNSVKNNKGRNYSKKITNYNKEIDIKSDNKYINAFMKMTDEEIKMVQDLLEN